MKFECWTLLCRLCNHYYVNLQKQHACTVYTDFASQLEPLCLWISVTDDEYDKSAVAVLSPRIPLKPAQHHPHGIKLSITSLTMSHTATSIPIAEGLVT